MGLFAVDSEKMAVAQEVFQQINLFCQDYWFGGPVLVCIVALVQGYRNRRNMRSLVVEKEEAVKRASINIRTEDAARLAREKYEKEEKEKEANDPTKQAERRIYNMIWDALNFGSTHGLSHWNWWANDKKLTCSHEDYDKLSIMVSEPKPQEKSFKSLSYWINGENVTDLITRMSANSSSHHSGTPVVEKAKQFIFAKWTALETERLHKLADQIGTTKSKGHAATTFTSVGTEGRVLVPTPVPMAKPVETVTFVPTEVQATPEMASWMSMTNPSPADAKTSVKMYDKLVAILKDRNRWYPTAEVGYYTDKSGVVNFRSRNKTDAEIFISGSQVMMLFTFEQQLALAKLCDDKVQSDGNRQTALETLVANLNKVS